MVIDAAAQFDFSVSQVSATGNCLDVEQLMGWWQFWQDDYCDWARDLQRYFR